MTTTSPLHEPIDGRTARAVRTHDGIVDACLELIDEGDIRPTGPRIAERAGVSVRSVFQHFDDLETLFSAVGDRVVARLSRLVVPIDPADPVESRVDAFVDQRARMLETVTPVMRAALVYAASSAVITRQFQEGHDFYRDQVAHVFGPELAATPDPAVVAAALAAASSWPTWELWRQREGRAVDEARRAMAWTVRAVLAAAARSC